MNRDPDVPVRRYAVVAALAIGALLVVTLLVRPFIFSFSDARDDSRYPVIGTQEMEAAGGPRVLEIVLNQPHGLPGEQVSGDVAGLRVVVTPLLTQDGYVVLNAWSESGGCDVMVRQDRLADCGGATWTFEGVPIDAAAPLQRFPAEARNGAIVVDFTQPQSAATP